jgi:hypothetical protein
MMVERRAPQRNTLSTVIQSAQLIVLVVGVGGIFAAIGRRDATLDHATLQIVELRGISSDLVRLIGNGSTTDATHSAQLASIEQRIDRLERVR